MLRSRLLASGVVAFMAFGFMASGAFGADEQSPQERLQNMPRARRGNPPEISGPMLVTGSENVKKDLSLTDDQKEQLKTIADDMRKQFQGNRDASKDLSPQERMAKGNAARKEMEKKIDGVLTDQQKARLKEIVLQAKGALALKEDPIQDQLKVTEDQEQSLKELNKDLTKALGEAKDRETRQAALKQSKEKMLAVLTAGQREQFEKMQGTKVDLSDMHFGSFGGRGRRNRNADADNEKSEKPESKSDSKSDTKSDSDSKSDSK